MNRYQRCIVEADKIKEQKREAAKDWYTYNWHREHVTQVLDHFDMITNVHRRTEIAALNAVQNLAYIITHTEITEFDDDMWRVYFTDLTLRIQWRNMIVMPRDIGIQTGLTEARVVSTLRHLDDVMFAREKLNMRPLPPIPIRYLYMQKRLRKLAREKDVAIGAAA